MALVFSKNIRELGFSYNSHKNLIKKYLKKLIKAIQFYSNTHNDFFVSWRL